MMNFKAAVFDMDGTLVGSLHFWGCFWRRLGEKYFNDPEFTPAEYIDKKVRTCILSEAGRFIRRELQIGNSDEEIAEFLGGSIGDFYRHDVDYKPGVVDFLEFCKSRGIRMCIASATGTDNLKIASEALGFDRYFEFILSCDEVGRGKEYPDVYLEALRRLGTSASDTWIFEDSFVALETASKLGMFTVGVYDRFNFDQDKLRGLSGIYIGENETFSKVRDMIEKL